MPRKRPSSACDEHVTGGGSQPVYGSKFTIASCRKLNQYGSRVILDMQHNGGKHSSDPDEATATVTMAKELRSATGGGLKGLVVDSVLRGQAVADLERNSVTVVNFPHAARNPGSRSGQRRGPDSTEKSYLRSVLTHTDANGTPCEHRLFFYGGVLVEGVIGHDGQKTAVAVQIDGYQQRGSESARRQYFLATVRCPLAGDFTERVPLFHVDGTSTDPDVNYGEVARVFAPNSSQFRRLYGMRNDTESRHTNLKASVKHLPIDVRGQELRLIGAALASNAVAWQLELQLAGEDNVFDNTA